MSNTVNNLTSASEPTVDLNRPTPVEAPPAAPPPPNLANQSNFRLIIEEDQATGSFVYKTLNRDTGEVIVQFPREQVLKLKAEARYQAGAIIKTTA